MSNNACGLPFGISKNSDKISQKINPQKSSKDFDVQNPEKIINNGATTHRHARPQISSDPRISHSNLCRSEKNFTKLMQPLDPLAHDLQNLKISSLKMAVRAATRCHAPPKSFDTPRHSPSNLCEPIQNFTKLTLQGSSAALDLQDLKISGQDAQPRASTRHRKVRRSSASFHAPSRADAEHSRAFTRSTRQVLTRALCA